MIAKVFLDPCPLCITAAPASERSKPKQKRCKGHAGDALILRGHRVDVFLDLEAPSAPLGKTEERR